jgi:hypothetical protein
MQTQEIPREQWSSFLDDFSRNHLGQQVKLWVSSPKAGLLREAVNLPLVGIFADHPAGRGERIDVVIGDSPEAHVTHQVHGPSAVRVAVDDGGADMSIQIDADDHTSTFVDLAVAGKEQTAALQRS